MTHDILIRILTYGFLDLRGRGRELNDNVVFGIADGLHNVPSMLKPSFLNAPSEFHAVVGFWLERNSDFAGKNDLSKHSVSRLRECIESGAPERETRAVLIDVLTHGLNDLCERGRDIDDPVVLGISCALHGVPRVLASHFDGSDSEFRKAAQGWLEGQSNFPAQVRWIEHAASQAGGS